MTAYPYTVDIPLSPDGTASASAYDLVSGTDFSELVYANLISTPLLLSGTNPTSNYLLSFSTSAPSPHPSIGQLWPRGAGES